MLPRVFLVGAGPGHPGLATLRAVECLRQTDVVIYDKLAPAALLDFAPAHAEKISVVELGSDHVERSQPTLDLMIAKAQQGKTVVRLKGGDPLVFGRGGEEAQALHAAGIPFEIVPGVTAALGAAAFAGIPLTHRQHASAVAIVTGHEDPGKPESALDWPALARFPGTLVFYMGIARLERITKALIEHGKDAATPAAVVYWASTGAQRTMDARLVDLPPTVQHAGITPPALIIIGDVVALRPELAWFEKMPLFGKRVLVTRPKLQAGDLVTKLAALGAVPIALPAVEIREPMDWTAVDRAIAELQRYDWLVFTSANGVYAFLGRLLHQNRDLRSLGHTRLAAIGPKTAAALRSYHLFGDLVPAKYQSEDLAAALLEKIKPGARILLARADRGRDVLRQELAKTCTVEQIAVYSQVDAVEPNHPALEQLRRGEIDFITLTSSNIAKAILAALDEVCRQRILSGRTRLVSISPVTSADIRALGLPVAVEAKSATSDDMLEALIEWQIAAG
ncbi:MAG: uroporphyrinogen-III C-methyltransferase [Gemmataceae bacterium]|nr:uroporphyrinogen-III C-methyltransferase [Gemmataceae bacterium]